MRSHDRMDAVTSAAYYSDVNSFFHWLLLERLLGRWWMA